MCRLVYYASLPVICAGWYFTHLSRLYVQVGILRISPGYMCRLVFYASLAVICTGWYFTHLSRLYVQVGILLTCGIHWQDKGWAHTASLTPATFYWPACSEHRKWTVMYLCVKGYRFLLFLQYWYLILELFRQCGISRIVPTVWYF